MTKWTDFTLSIYCYYLILVTLWAFTFISTLIRDCIILAIIAFPIITQILPPRALFWCAYLSLDSLRFLELWTFFTWAIWCNNFLNTTQGINTPIFLLIHHLILYAQFTFALVINKLSIKLAFYINTYQLITVIFTLYQFT